MRQIVFRQWRLAAAGIGLPLLALLASQIVGIESKVSAKKPGVVARAAAGHQTNVEPRVAERIGLDPSIRETPSLPVEHQEESEPEHPVTTHLTDDEPAQTPVEEPGTSARPASVLQGATAPAPVAWPMATSLLAQLDKLAASDPSAEDWVEKVKAELTTINSLPSLADSRAVASFAKLHKLAGQVKELARQGADDDSRSRILRAGFALVRRLAIWEPLHDVAVSQASAEKQIAPVLSSSHQVLGAVQRVQEDLVKTGDAAAWRKYLMLDQLVERCTAGTEVTPEQRNLARGILYRYHSTQLSSDQAALLEKPSLRQFAEHLQSWGAEHVDLADLVSAIEKYETDEASPQATAIAQHYDLLRWSKDEEVSALADAVNSYYRNANVRVAISAELVNRLLPKEMRTAEAVQDTIQGAYVEGQSETSTRLRLVLLPDRFRWRLGLEAKGEVASSTASTAGPATFFQDGAAFYRARKLLTIDRKSIRMHEAEAEAASETQLNDLQTNFDGIPLFGAFARMIARNQYDQKTPAARQEVEGKIINRATGTLDQQVAERIQKAKKDFESKLLSQLQQLQLDPTAVDMETTQDRLIARYRLAGREQLSAHTPRPQAPGDSLLSVQVHETALNNALEHLRLAGRKVELHDLFKEMTARFGEQQVPVPHDLPEGVFVTFADTDPVRLDFQDGRLRIMIHLQELSLTNSHKTFKNLIVKGYYRPHPDQLDANLERDGIIELGGNFLKAGDRLFLAGVFDRILSRNRKLNLVNERISKSPELKDQQVTQFVIHDGWIGVALGPKLPSRTALQTKIPQR